MLGRALRPELFPRPFDKASWAEPTKEPPLQQREVEETQLEVEEMLSKKNPATQMLRRQSEELKLLKRKGLIDDFRHMEMVKMLTNFYTHQGKAERIKNFPLPRQYATVSLYFVLIFIIMLPLTLLPGGLSIFGNWVQMLLWVHMWAPFYAILNYIMQINAQEMAGNIFDGLS